MSMSGRRRPGLSSPSWAVSYNLVALFVNRGDAVILKVGEAHHDVRLIPRTAPIHDGQQWRQIGASAAGNSLRHAGADNLGDDVAATLHLDAPRRSVHIQQPACIGGIPSAA